MGAEPDAQESFGPYLVYERLGVGGMATVHRALERGIEGFERIVALKRLLPHLAEDATFIKAFVREAKLASALNHVNIVQIYELGRVGTEYFISMEYIDGRDIRRVLRHARKVTGPPPPNVTVGLLLQLCDALDYAHTKIDENGVPMGLVHRDVSPSNVLITSGGNVKVIDFGIAKAQSSQLRTQTGRVKGKLAYMAPEAISGGRDLDARSDLFAIGVIAHELLTARPLFASKNEYQTLLKVQRGDIMPPSTFNQSVPAELDAIVLRALARDPDDRFSSAAELRDELVALRHKYRLQTGVRDISMWLDWAFSLDMPSDAVASGGVASDAPIADIAWDGGDGSGSPIVLDDVPDVSQRVAMPPAQPIRESQPRLFDEDPGIDADDSDDDDDIPTPVPVPPRRPSTPNVVARAATGSRAASTSSSHRAPERRSSELLDALHAANDAAATLENMPIAQAFGVDTQPTGRSLPIDRVSTGQIDRSSTGQIERSSTNEIERSSQSDIGDQTSVVVQRAPEAPTFDPAMTADDHVTGENQPDSDPTTGKSQQRAPANVVTEDERDAVIDPPRPSRTAVGVARNTPHPSQKTAPMIPLTPPQRPTPDLSRATPDPMRATPHSPSLSTPVSEGSAATSAATSEPPPGISVQFKSSPPEVDAPPKKPRTKLGHQPARAPTTTPHDDETASTQPSVERKARQPNLAASSIGMSIIERDAKPNRTWLVLTLIALVVGAAAGTLYLTRTTTPPPTKQTDDKPRVGTTGTVAVELEPTDAEVSIDGTLVHTGSPWQTDLTAGSHSIEIHKQGYKAWLTTVNVTAGERQMFTVALAPLGGTSVGSGSVSKQPAVRAPSAPSGGASSSGTQAPTTAPAPSLPAPHAIPTPDSRGDATTPTTNDVVKTEAPPALPMATTLYAGTTPPSSTAGSADPAVTTGTQVPPTPTAIEAKPVAPVASNAPPATTAAPAAPSITKPAAPTTPIVATSRGPATVAPSAVKKLSGALPELVSKNEVATVVAAKLCIDWQGSVTSVELISKLEPRMALEMKKTLATWKYAPYQAAGGQGPSAACFAVSFRTQ